MDKETLDLVGQVGLENSPRVIFDVKVLGKWYLGLEFHFNALVMVTTRMGALPGTNFTSTL